MVQKAICKVIDARKDHFREILILMVLDVFWLMHLSQIMMSAEMCTCIEAKTGIEVSRTVEKYLSRKLALGDCS